MTEKNDTLKLIPFSELYPDEFLSRTEDNFPILLEKIKLVYDCTRSDIADGTVSRRMPSGRYRYADQITDLQINRSGMTTEQVLCEVNEMLRGTVRSTDPSAAFNITPTPLFDVVAGMTLFSLYAANDWWDLTGGNVCLFERKIVALLGQLVGWSNAEGLVVSGGKQSLIYAIRCGVARACCGHQICIDDLVVVSSELAHFSIDHVCHYLGIKPTNSLRVATGPSGEIDPSDFENVLCDAICRGKRIAAVIALGGATINMIPDSVHALRQIIDKVASQCRLDYSPYLHMDAVVSWPWLAFSDAEDNSWREGSSSRVVEKIDHVLLRLRETQYADSFSVDFHKTGFCPYPAGVFIAREGKTLTALPLDGKYPGNHVLFGQAEMFRSTLENSRSGISVAAIWIALRRMGLEGFQKFVLYQLNVCEVFKRILRMRYCEHFEIINEHSNNCEIVMMPRFGSRLSWDGLQNCSDDLRVEYIRLCHKFLEFSWYGSLDCHPHRTPVIGFVKSYAKDGHAKYKLPAFLIYPSSLHYNEKNIEEMLEAIVDMKREFQTLEEQLDPVLAKEVLEVTTPPR